MSRQAIPYRDRVHKLGTGPGLCELGRPTLAVGTCTHEKAARMYDRVGSPCVATRVFSVTTQGQKGLCRDREHGQARHKEFCRDRDFSVRTNFLVFFYHDRDFPIATESARPCVSTEFHVS